MSDLRSRSGGTYGLTPRRFAKSGSLLTRGTTTGRPLYMTNESDTEDKELQRKYSYQ